MVVNGNISSQKKLMALPLSHFKDNQQPSLEGNLSEGSTTEESLNLVSRHGDNSCLDGVTHLGMPGALNRAVIQSDLTGNCEREVEILSRPFGVVTLWIQPLRLRRDYSAVGRKTFLVEQLPDGALPIYDKDPDVTAFVVGEEGENILAIQKPRRVIFPLFEIASNPEIPLTQIKERRFDLN
jgi:hypothetical protein